MSTEEALEWAFQQGNSTKKDISSGNGLTILNDFINQNQGILTICTNDGCIKISDNMMEYTYINRPFLGTLVNITLQCDESAYCLSTEN